MNTPHALLPADEVRIKQKYEVKLQALAQEGVARKSKLSVEGGPSVMYQGGDQRMQELVTSNLKQIMAQVTASSCL